MSRKSINKKRFLSILLCIALLLITVLPIYADSSDQGKEVIVGGCLFGLRMQTKGILIVGLDKVEAQKETKAPAFDAGIKLKDVIIKINGKVVTSTTQVTECILSCKGKPVVFTVQRGAEIKEISVTPLLAKDGKYHAGIWIRDSAAGIGTVTYIDPQTYEFAGLGHGICDGDTTSLLPLSRGIVTEVTLSSVIKGQKGVPGELKGSFKGGKVGSLINNTENGVYGIYTSLPGGIGQKMKTAAFSEVYEGDAFIRSDVSGRIQDYKIKIEKINTKNTGGKNLTIKVTDEALLKITGGIVQGMSGSPIIQNGKLVGAVTHVLINDPTTGYGIFIENMLNAVQMPMAKAS